MDMVIIYSDGDAIDFSAGDPSLKNHLDLDGDADGYDT